jgi:DNA (cytosine-5)-methyltransferase 1
MTGFNADNGVVEIGNIYPSGGQNGNVYNANGICPTLLSGTTNTKGNGGIGSCNAPKISMEEPQYRIRKLTPRECWRLMDFTDEDFEKAAQVNSNTQLYKQAGNSIIRNVLVAILGQLIEGKEDAYRKL